MNESPNSENSNRTCAITGATGGIGAALARLAASEGFSLVLHGRSEGKLTALRAELERAVPTLNAATIVGDLDTAAGAHRVAASIATAAPQLDVLFNNAGVLLAGEQISADGMDLHAQVNLIAPYILMRQLKPQLAEAHGVIVNVSSGSALRAKELSIAELKRPRQTTGLSGPYATSKLALAVVTRLLAPEFASDDVGLACATPGPVKSEMTRGGGMPTVLRLLAPLLFRSPAQGASKLFSALDRARSEPGSFFDGSRIRELPAFTLSETLQAELVAFCEAAAQHR